MKLRISKPISAFLLVGLLLPLHGQSPQRSQALGIRVAEDGVYVRVLVTDSLNRFIAGLEQKHFKVYENRVEQPIHYFSQQTAPISMGVIFDLAGSMKNYIGAAVLAINRFREARIPGDEFFLISFSESSAMVQDFGLEPSTPQEIPIIKSSSQSPLRQALAMGLEKIKKGKNEKKALIIVSDLEVTSILPTVQVYTVSGDRWGNRMTATREGTGVRPFVADRPSEVDYYIDIIHDELRNQYILGYIPTNRKQDGKWRRIEVKLNPPQGLPKLVVNASQGYYAREN